jgi:transmembrane sensor
MNLDDIKKKLADGTLTPEEIERLFPIDDFVRKGEYQLPEETINQALLRLKKKTRPVIQWRKISRYAAMLTLLLGSAFLLRGLLNKKVVRPLRSMKVENGRQGKLLLPDGSQIVINGGSELLFPEKFDQATRTVILKTGEAYFEIAPDAKHPFIVQAASQQVRVLGTSFSIRDYQDEKQSSVTVNSGRVAVGQYELTAGTGTIYNKQTGILTKQTVDTTAATAWTRGELIFNDTTLQDVVQVLQHKYAIAFEVKDSAVLRHRFTATFRDNSIETIMQQLKLMSSFDYTIKNDQVTIK